MFQEIHSREVCLFRQGAQEKLYRLVAHSDVGSATWYRQPLSTLLYAMGDPNSTLLLDFDKHGEFAVTVNSDSVALFPLIVDRHSLAVPMGGPTLRLTLEDEVRQGRRLTEGRISLLSHAPVDFARSFVVLSHSPLQASVDDLILNDSPADLDVGAELNRQGSVTIFLRGEVILSRSYSNLALPQPNRARPCAARSAQNGAAAARGGGQFPHQLFRVSANQDLVLIIHGTDVDCIKVTIQPMTSSKRRPLPLSLATIKFVKQESGGKPFFSPLEEEGIEGFTFDASAFAPALVLHTYFPNLVSTTALSSSPDTGVSIADCEIRCLGPATDSPELILLVIGLTLIPNGKVGKDLGALLCLCEADSTIFILKWIDLRKNTTQSCGGFLLCRALEEWAHFLTQRDPRLSSFLRDTQCFSNEVMERGGSVAALLHPFVNVCIVHDEDQDREDEDNEWY